MAGETSTQSLNREQLVRLAANEPHRLGDLSLAELGELHRALKAALADVKAAMDPVIVREAHRGMTYVELAHASGYGSFATIARIMKDHPVPKGPRPFR